MEAVDALRGATSGADALYPPTAVPSVRPLPLLPFLIAFVRNPLRALPAQVYDQPIVVHEAGSTVIAWVADPALIEIILQREQEAFPKTPIEKRVFAETLGDGILTSEGAAWRWQRRIAAPLFRHSELVRYVPAMSDAAEERLARWRASPSGGVRAIDRDMTDSTFTVIAGTMLSGAALEESAAILRAGAEFLDRITWEIAAAMVRVPTWVWHPGKAPMRRASRELRSAVAAILARRRAQADAGDDLLARLIDARHPETGAPMSDEQLIDNLITFLTAGHETTAKALTWTLYLLARSPEWQERVRAEVSDIAGESPIGAEHLDRLRVTQQVLKESLRLYPPAPVLTRTTVATLDLGAHRLAPGTLVVIPIFAVHRHKHLWVDPDRFDPARFTAEREAECKRTQFMPFGFGPRICIGSSFAMIEATAMLATFVRGARFDWDGKHLPEPMSRVTLRPKGGMPLQVTLT